jgi:signal-transduction protein with cAMP-binding, CBS, and nucleotidyltransferase domain
MAAKRMSESAVGCLVVTVGDAVKGIITDRDLLTCLSQRHDPHLCAVSAHMRHPVMVLRPDEKARTAAAVMRARRIKRLPVAKNGKLLGIVSLSDLAALASEEAKKLGSSLDFFSDVVRAQSAQHNLPKHTASVKPAPAVPASDCDDGTNRSEMIDVGGPG